MNIPVLRDAMLARRLGPEVRKTVARRLESGFFDRYLSGPNVLDIGYRGNDPSNEPIVPHAVGIERDYPGYDGRTLPFPDQSQDAVHSSHCLEHISDPLSALGEWFRVLKIGGFLVLTVPHQELYERKPSPTSRWGGNEHERFYTPARLMAEVEAALPVGEFRLRSLRDNDEGFPYDIRPEDGPSGCYEIELVIQRIARPAHTETLRFSAAALGAIEVYRTLIDTIIRMDAAGTPVDPKILAAFGRALEIPPCQLIRPMFAQVSEENFRRLVRPLVDPSRVDQLYYLATYVDARAFAEDDPGRTPEHYAVSGYFECKLPNRQIGLYG